MRAHQVRVEKGVVAGYIHNKIGDKCGLRASLVGLESEGDSVAVEKLAKDLAMHVVPTFLFFYTGTIKLGFFAKMKTFHAFQREELKHNIT